MRHKRQEIRNGVKRKTRLYVIWANMRSRCLCDTDSDYHRYGGRGISICDEWKSFDVFANWAMQEGYGQAKSLDRIDNDGNYSPKNCRWVSLSEQRRHQRKCHWIEHDGKRMTMGQWAQEIGISISTMVYRVRNWGEKRAVSTPSLRGKQQ